MCRPLSCPTLSPEPSFLLQPEEVEASVSSQEESSEALMFT